VCVCVCVCVCVRESVCECAVGCKPNRIVSDFFSKS
jgi:hypothetical protein